MRAVRLEMEDVQEFSRLSSWPGDTVVRLTNCFDVNWGKRTIPIRIEKSSVLNSIQIRYYATLCLKIKKKLNENIYLYGSL